jgi:transposase
MGQNFIGCDREQVLLMPPSLMEWLPEDHFTWFVLAAVAEMDLSAFYAAYRLDGHGRAAHDPAVMVALLLYAYARGRRSSRAIERACVEDVAYRVIAANHVPDHCTIARFRQRHQDALAGLFGEVLELCAEAGLVGVGLVAVDGTKVHANASRDATRDYDRIAEEILADADAVDRTEDERSATLAATSCRPSCRRRRAAAAGCARRSAGSTRSAPRRRGRSPSRDRNGCSKASGALRRNSRQRRAPTPTTRPTGRADG